MERETELLRGKFERKEPVIIIFKADDFLAPTYLLEVLGEFFEAVNDGELKKIKNAVFSGSWEEFKGLGRGMRVRFLCQPNKTFWEWFRSRLYQRVEIA